MTHSDATKEKQRADALRRGRQRRAAILKSLRRALHDMAAKIRNNGGKYPGENGLSLVEIFRCAAISEKTIYQPTYAKAKGQVDRWLARQILTEDSEASSGRRSLAERLDEWREKYQDLLGTHLRDQDLWIEERRLRIEAEERVAQLESQLAKLMKGNVVVLSAIPQRPQA